MEATLEVNDLRKHYGGFTLDVSFTVGAGRTLALLGPNGSGKTTLIRALLNVVRRDGGRVRFFGLDLDAHEVAIKRRLGVVLEEPRLFEELRVTQLLAFYESFYPDWDRSYARALLDDLGVDAGAKFKALSKGTRVKLALVLALAPRPRLLVLDEPTAGLDPKMRRQFVATLRAARAQFAPTVLFASHVMRDVEDLADEIAFIEEGRIKLRQNRAEMLDWHVIECGWTGALPLPADDVIADRRGRGAELKLLTARRDAVVARLRDCRADVRRVYPPDLEELYDLIIGPPR